MGTANSISFNRRIIVGVLLAASFVAILNQTLLIVALPPIMDDFGIGPSQAQWVTTAFMLMNGIMIPITAFLIEKFSSRRLLIFAISIFIVGTCIGAVAPSFSLLLFARIIQAVGAGILMPLMQTVLLTIYPIEKRGAAMGMGGLVIGFAPAIGPTLSGWIIDHFTWRHLFYTVLPVSMFVLLLAIFLMKNVTEQKKVKVDLLSIILSSLGWGGLLYGFSMVGSVGWVAPTVITAIGLGAVTLALFVWRQNRLEAPMLNFSVFRSKEFTVTTLLSVIMFGVMIGIETILPLYIQHVRGGTALQSGLLLLPGAIITGAMSPVAGKIFDKLGARGMVIVGFALMLSATLMYIRIDTDFSLPFLAVIFLIKMLGVSLLMTPLMTSGINSLPFHLIAHGTAMNNTIRMVGGSIVIAVIISTMGIFTSSSTSTNPSIAMLEGMHAAFMTAAILVFVGLLFAFSLRKKSSQEQRGIEN